MMVATGAAFVLALTGCSSSGGDGSSGGNSAQAAEQSPLQVVQAAYGKSTGAKTAKVALKIDATAPAGGGVTSTGEGAVDFARKASQLTLKVASGQELETRQIDQIAYLKLPEQLTQQVPGRKPWLKLDLEALAKSQLGTSLSQLQGNAGSDPGETLGYLRGVSGEVTEVGTEQIRGTDTTHYRATVDLKKAAEQAGGQAKAGYDKLQAALGRSTLPVELWVDSDGLVRRISQSTPLPANPGVAGQDQAAAQGKVSIVMDLYDYGAPVKVTAPPATETTDAAELIAQQQQQQQEQGAGR